MGIEKGGYQPRPDRGTPPAKGPAPVEVPRTNQKPIQPPQPPQPPPQPPTTPAWGPAPKHRDWSPEPKVAAAAVTTPFSGLILWIAGQMGLDIPQGVAGEIAVLIALAAAYLMPPRQR
jgi:hypothetical protein